MRPLHHTRYPALILKSVTDTGLASELRRFLRFILVGCCGVLLNTIILYLLVEEGGFEPLLAAAFATEVVILSNFFLNDRWTFRHERGLSHLPFWRRATRYNLVAAVGLLFSLATLALLTMVYGMNYLAANLVAIGIATTWNYLVSSRYAWAGLRESEGWGQFGLALVRFALPRISGSAFALLARGAILLALIVIMRIDLTSWLTIAALVFALALLIPAGLARREVVTRVFALAVGVSALGYLSWRFGVLNWASWWIAVPLFAAEALGAAHTLGLQYTIWPRPPLQLTASENPSRRPIFIFIPTVNEGPAILGPTIESAIAARDAYLAEYPDGRVEIVVCNDGLVGGSPRWQEVVALAARLGVTCCTRTVGGGAKAGNIESARQQRGAIGDALIVIFDADQIARPEFLLATIPPFADPAIGWVQSGQYYRNLDNPVARWANDQQGLFYRVLCPGKAAQDSAFICGTNVVIRAAALDEIGGLPQHSVTEDFVASIELHPRWRSIFLRDELAHGIGPTDLPSYFMQQRRWAIGTLGALRSHWSQIFLPTWSGLRLNQRLQYALACTHYLSGVRDAIYLIAPIAFLVTGIPAVRGADLSAFLWHFLPYWLASQLAFWHVARGRTSLRGIVIGFGSFPTLIGSLVTVISGHRVRFTVTAKERTGERSWRHLLPHTLGLIACLGGLILALLARGDRGPILISALWVVYTALMLSGVLWLGLADHFSGSGIRRARRVSSRHWHLGPGNARRPALLVLAVVLAVTPIIAVVANVASGTSRPEKFSPASEPDVRRIGATVPLDLLQSRPTEIEQQLGVSLGIVGRSQTIDDHFDRAWADRLAAHGTRPWLTLLFTIPGASSLDASLPAIGNGIHDDALRQWAREIRAYGQPVYLSVLPYLDRNWAVSSAVSNGGIPQDGPRAWEHIRAIFDQEGAANVAWVWAAADPARDQDYAPPPSEIDVVLLSLIAYPDTEWSDPTASLAEVAARYPNTPLFLEVSAAGDAQRKAAWLRATGQAIATIPNARGLLYHEGSPDPKAVGADHDPWSLNSDPLALLAMRETSALLLAGPAPQATPAITGSGIAVPTATVAIGSTDVVPLPATFATPTTSVAVPTASAVTTATPIAAPFQTGQLVASIDYSSTIRSVITAQFDLGSAGRERRLYFSIRYITAGSERVVEMVSIGDQAWQREMDGSWQATTLAPTLQAQLQTLLPQTMGDEVSNVSGTGQIVSRWFDSERGADVVLYSDVADGLPREMQLHTRNTGITMVVSYQAWNGVVAIPSPPAR